MAPPDQGAAAGGARRRWVRRETLLGLALGQFVSLLITATGFASSELARRGTCIPTVLLLHYATHAASPSPPARPPGGRRQPSRGLDWFPPAAARRRRRRVLGTVACWELLRDRARTFRDNEIDRNLPERFALLTLLVVQRGSRGIWILCSRLATLLLQLDTDFFPQQYKICNLFRLNIVPAFPHLRSI